MSAPVADTEFAPATTPTVRQTARRGVYWAVAGIALALLVVVIGVIRGGGAVGGPPLAADSAGAAGSKALVEVLRQQGVRVEVVGTLAAAEAAAGDGEATTLFFSDPGAFLAAGDLARMAAVASDTVVAGPDFTVLQTIAPGVSAGGAPTGQTLSASCALAAAERAGTISAGTNSLAVSDGWVGCFPAGDDTFALLQNAHDERTLTLLADGTVLANATIAENGNAALVLGLLGANETLVWYLPTLADVVSGEGGETGATLAELTPAWVTPVLVLLVLAVLAAASWRGRRFGALVVENLPVTVHASETMEGRARLYARTSSRLRTADALRIGTIDRLARHLALPRTASVEEVASVVASVSGIALDTVRDVLVRTEPHTDRELIALSAHLTELERAVGLATAIPPVASVPTERMDP